MLDIHAVGARLRVGEAVLFVGAGATRDGGGLTWVELAKRIAEVSHYTPPKDEQEPQDVIDSALREGKVAYDKIYEDVQKRLEAIVAPSALRHLLDLPWLAICTTNYDTAIEDYLREHSQRRLDVVRDGRRAVQFGEDRIPVFKLRGCRTVPANRPGSMVFATKDIRRHTREQAPMYDHLDELTQHVVVAVGYGFGDNLLLESAEVVRSLRVNDAVPIVGVFRSEATGSTEAAMREKLRRRDVSIIEKVSIDDLATQLKAEIGSIRFESSIALRVRGASIAVPKRAVEDALQSFQPVTEEDCRRKVSAREFLRGDTTNSGAYQAELFWRRAAHDAAVAAFERWFENQTRPPRHLIVNFSGPPGSGRTVASHVLLHHVINKHHGIGLRAPPRAPRLDTIAGSQILQAVQAARTWESLPFLAVCADEHVNLADALQFAAGVQSPDHGVLVIRSSSDDLTQFSRQADAYEIVDIRLPDQIGLEEVDSLSRYISTLPAELRRIPWNSAEILEAAKRNPSFLHLMYTLVDPSKRSFDGIILDEFARNDYETRKLVQTLALFTAMRVPLPSSLLAKSLRVPQDELRRRASETALVRIDSGAGGLQYFTLYHPIVGRLLIEPSQGLSRATVVETIQTVVGAANLSNVVEHQTIAELLVPTHSAPVAEYLDPDELLALFESLKQKGPTRLLLHHHGLLLRDRRDYGRAIEVLGAALDQPDDRIRASERREIVITSLAHVQWLKLLDEERPMIDDPRVQAIRIDLSESRKGARNPNAYTIEARILRDIAQWTPSPAREMLLGEACAILEDGLRTCGAEEEGLIDAVESVLDASVGFTQQDAYKIWDEFGSGYGYFLLYQRAKRIKSAVAHELLEIALDARIPCPSALREAIHLELTAAGPDYKKALEWSDKLFEYAETRTRRDTLDRYDHIQRIAALVGVGIGSLVAPHIVAARTGEPGYDPQPYRYLIRRDGEPVLYSGRVKEIVTPRSGRIHEHLIRGLGDLHFNPSASQYAKSFERGEPVKFQIAIGAKGITAWEVRPMERRLG